ncbi:MAG: winged helix-turn-helix domain-containing protein [Bacillota bacterium]|nr:helix-turn-helix domain-containing protein [Candidatus Fermentithermobacillaceae bacterium]
MYDSRRVLFSCTASPPLKDLLRGTATNLGIGFREISRLDEICETRSLAPPVVVVEGESPSDELFASLSRLTSSMKVWLALVTSGEPTVTDIVRSIAAGVANCIGFWTAMQAISYLIRNILKASALGDEPVQTGLPVSGKAVLLLPGHFLVCGERQVTLPPIPGRLLECMARNRDRIVSSDDLKRSGWGTSNGVTNHALCQQVCRLREVLDVFGLGNSVKCFRGKGYLLKSSPDDRI